MAFGLEGFQSYPLADDVLGSFFVQFRKFVVRIQSLAGHHLVETGIGSSIRQGCLVSTPRIGASKSLVASFWASSKDSTSRFVLTLSISHKIILLVSYHAFGILVAEIKRFGFGLFVFRWRSKARKHLGQVGKTFLSFIAIGIIKLYHSLLSRYQPLQQEGSFESDSIIRFHRWSPRRVLLDDTLEGSTKNQQGKDGRYRCYKDNKAKQDSIALCDWKIRKTKGGQNAFDGSKRGGDLRECLLQFFEIARIGIDKSRHDVKLMARIDRMERKKLDLDRLLSTTWQ
mmetsp:Transcript_13605/g.34220  ORF Transcript_13605/g.34220 Transcript_13605/m.34220 type:complete len:285 (-) Transcript_13605:20-874(-)